VKIGERLILMGFTVGVRRISCWMMIVSSIKVILFHVG
jgi:hypothetical protein